MSNTHLDWQSWTRASLAVHLRTEHEQSELPPWLRTQWSLSKRTMMRQHKRLHQIDELIQAARAELDELDGGK